MGAEISKDASVAVDAVTQVSNRRSSDSSTSLEPLLEKLRELKVVTPVLRIPSEGTNLKEVVLRTAGISVGNNLSSKSAVELWSVYENWSRSSARTLAQNQDGVHGKLDLAEALAIKLLQRLHNAASVMKAGVGPLQEVARLQTDLARLKKDMTGVVDSFRILCKQLEDQGLVKVEDIADAKVDKVAR